jgi:hypothetical protein
MFLDHQAGSEISADEKEQRNAEPSRDESIRSKVRRDDNKNGKRSTQPVYCR